MSLGNYLSAVALATALSVSVASAATFTIEPGDVTITGKDFCFPGDCKLDGAVLGGNFDLSTVGEIKAVDDLFDWQVLLTHPWASGAGAYSVNVNLNFSSPSSEVAEGTGHAGFITAFGTITKGVLEWTSGSGSLNFADGHVLNYSFKDALKFGFGTGTTTGATFTLAETPAPVPLPASVLLLLGGVGALGGIRARRKRKA